MQDKEALKEHGESAHLQEYRLLAEELTDKTEIKNLRLAQYGSVNCNYAGECELSDDMWD